jgi:drug/metabolite transporter (DMT)-like permease
MMYNTDYFLLLIPMKLTEKAFPQTTLARIALLYVAIFWGMSWLAFRYLYDWGMSGMSVGIAISIAATVFAWVLARSHLRAELASISKPALILMAVSAAFSNLGFTWGMVHGEVMRVMLLFYLMPVWTGLMATLIFGERTNWAGWLGIALGLLGAMVMLYDPAKGLPLPANAAEWSGLGAGFASALLNVQVRHVSTMRSDVQAFVYGFGAIVVGGVWLQFESGSHLPRSDMWLPAVALIVLMGALLMLSYRMYQFGLKYLTSHQAVVIFPFELVVGAVSSALIAHEMMSTRAWVGGFLIAFASFISSWWGVADDAH